MKKAELKKILKPLVKECVKEIILDEGILSGVISEVARGISGAQTSAPAPVRAEEKVDPEFERMRRNAFTREESTKLKESKNKLMSAIGSRAYNGVNLFEGTTPTQGPLGETQMSSPMAGQNPGDPGVDIRDLFGSVGNHWNAHMEKKGK